MNNQPSLLITSPYQSSNNNSSLNKPINNNIQTSPIQNTQNISHQSIQQNYNINHPQPNQQTNISNIHINTQTPNQFNQSQPLNNPTHINNQLNSNPLQQHINNQPQQINTQQQNNHHKQLNKQQSKPTQQSLPQNIIHNQHNDQQIKQFQIKFENYTFTFSLINNQFKIDGSKLLNQIHLNQTYSYQKFTQQMKALFQNPNQIWTILNQDQQNIQFQIQTHKLYFKIHLGGKQKKIHIPLSQNKQNDQQYIKKLQKTINKYIQTNKSLENQIKQLKQSCTCKHHSINKQQSINNINNSNNKDMNPKAKNKIKIQRDWLSSRASSTWPQFQIQQKASQQIQQTKINKQTRNKQKGQTNSCLQDSEQKQDPLIMFDRLIQTLNIIRDEFSSLIGQIEGKIQLRAGMKIIRIKMLSLQKKKRDYLSELQQQRKKFKQFVCKKDIDKQIDELVDYIIDKYQAIQTKINIMK